MSFGFATFNPSGSVAVGTNRRLSRLHSVWNSSVAAYGTVNIAVSGIAAVGYFAVAYGQSATLVATAQANNVQVKNTSGSTQSITVYVFSI